MTTLNEQIAADLDIFVDDQTGFAVTATIGGVEVTGILDNQYVEVLDSAGTHPVLTCKTADVAEATEGTAVIIAGVEYEVIVPQPDGTGITQLVLEEQ